MQIKQLIKIRRKVERATQCAEEAVLSKGGMHLRREFSHIDPASIGPTVDYYLARHPTNVICVDAYDAQYVAAHGHELEFA